MRYSRHCAASLLLHAERALVAVPLVNRVIKRCILKLDIRLYKHLLGNVLALGRRDYMGDVLEIEIVTSTTLVATLSLPADISFVIHIEIVILG